jgi:hypothetical protein
MSQSAGAEAVTYKIRVQGILDDARSAWVANLRIDVQASADAPPVTTLTGTLRDEDVLEEVLDVLNMLGLPLISVERMDTDRPGSTDVSCANELTS